jgi:predicted porin
LAYTDAGVALERSIGQANCLLGRSWGYDAEGIWVTEGCGAEFTVGNAAHEQQRLASQNAAPVVDVVPTDVDPRNSRDSALSTYARLGVVTALADGEAQVQDSGSRLRFDYSSAGDQRFFAAAEWAVNLTTSTSTINPGETTDGGFLSLEESGGDVLGARLGYVGIDLDDYGTLTLGKQWSVYYDVTGYTDAFNAFGAEATATFNSQTDGGFTGTGRADGALVYRNSFFNILDMGVQVQMRDLDNEEFVDGYGLSARARVLPRLEIGVSYVRSVIHDSVKGTIAGIEDDSEYRSVGLRYRNDRLTLSAVYAEQRNGDVARFPSFLDGLPISVTEVFDADGVEFFGRYEFGSFGVVGGFLHYSPRLNADNVLISPSAEAQYAITGFDYRAASRSLLFAEYRASSGVGPTGVPRDDVFVLGAKHEFSRNQN